MTISNDAQILKHAFATPLSSLLINLELALNNKIILNQKNDFYIKKALLAGKYLQALLSDQKQNYLQEFFIKDSIIEVLNILKAKHKDYSLINYLAITDNLKIKGHKLYFQESIICLINNALESYDDNSANKVVLISAHLKAEKSAVKKLHLTISDGGCGMSILRQKIAHLKGISFKKNHSGIGLNFCQKTIKKYFHGNFIIQSKKNHGTTIKIEIPVN